MMTTLGLDRFSVLGWSDGGITSLIVAAKYDSEMFKTDFRFLETFI